MHNSTLKTIFVILIIAAVLAGGLALADKPNKPSKPCKWRNLMCADVWDPVICNDGEIYSNSCYARRACATGCQPYGGGPVEF